MPIIQKEKWNKCVEINKDSYGKCCVDVARRVMELLDENNEPLKPGYHPNIRTPHGLICKANKDIDKSSITGFMAGCVASMVSECHSRGEEFRKAWNTQYTKEEKDGVVNPAILTFKNKD